MFKYNQGYESGNKNNRENVDIAICECFKTLKTDNNIQLTEIERKIK